MRACLAMTTPPALDLARPDRDTLYWSWRGYVATIALRMLGDVALADDVTQDVFVKARRSRHPLRDPAAARFWLARIAVLEARRRLRRRTLMRWVGMDTVPERRFIAPDASPEQRALLMRAYTRLDELPTRLRLAWTLRYFEGETLPRVAQLCRCSLATAKRRTAAAQARMREALDG
ncbi:MAG: RNA polymerase sigma-70 factor (ECF subfamily) [Bradymonadia bacterium]|jgi:RNA polymerase sigma-70 factor (ECF subfamily)